MDGKSLLKLNLHNVNLDALPKGIYLIKINSKTGVIIKKLIKKQDKLVSTN